MEYTYYYMGDKLMRMTVGTEHVMDFTYDQNGQPYSVTHNGMKNYYVLNRQGDVVRIVTSGGASRGIYRYDAWGNILYNTDSTFMNLNPLRYRGYVYDAETELYYCQSRYYDPATGRFINADAYASTGQGILGNNMFAYCRNNPVCRVDISGTADKDCLDEDPLDQEDILNTRGGGGSLSIRSGVPANSYSYSTPSGGGGTSSSVRVGNTTVTFGHGGRHMDFSDISGLESAIAHDVVTQPPTTGVRGEVPINFCGVDFTYRYWTMSNTHIHVGTYFYAVAK